MTGWHQHCAQCGNAVAMRTATFTRTHPKGCRTDIDVLAGSEPPTQRCHVGSRGYLPEPTTGIPLGAELNGFGPLNLRHAQFNSRHDPAPLCENGRGGAET